MDLPVEIRLMIARYAVKADKDMNFHWLYYCPTKRRATFEDLERLTALTRTCEQIRTEISSMAWETNTFHFHEHIPASFHVDDWSTPQYIPRPIREAIQFLLSSQGLTAWSLYQSLSQ